MEPMHLADAEEYTQSIAQIMGGGWRQILLAEKLGVPQALGLSTRDWVEQRLGGYVRLSISDRRQAVTELKAEHPDMSTREIAEVIGVSHMTVANDLTPVKNVTDAGDFEAVTVKNFTPTFTPPADWKAPQVAQAQEAIAALPEDERERAVAVISQPAVPAATAVKMLENIAARPEEDRAVIYDLAESDDARDVSLALTKAAEMPPMPDPRETKLSALCMHVRGELRACAAMFPGDPLLPKFRSLIEQVEALRGEVQTLHKERTA